MSLCSSKQTDSPKDKITKRIKKFIQKRPWMYLRIDTKHVLDTNSTSNTTNMKKLSRNNSSVDNNLQKEKIDIFNHRTKCETIDIFNHRPKRLNKI